MAFRAFTVPSGPNRTFMASGRVAPESIPYPRNLGDDEAVKKFVMNTYQYSYMNMQWQFARMRAIERFYSGLHYLLPQDNFDNEITNYAFSIVETVWPELVTDRPRPVIIPRGSGADAQRIRKHERLAEWCMDLTGFDDARRRGMRTKLKFGWNVWLMLQNARTGMPVPKHWSNWHFVADPLASDAQSLMHFFLASPVHVNVVRAVFGEKANDIKPDSYASPGFRALIENQRDYWMLRDEGDNSIPWAGSSIGQAKDVDGNELAQPSSAAQFVPANGAMPGADTSYLIQMVFRDLTKMQVVYEGYHTQHDPSGGEPVKWWGYWTPEENVCESGWRVATVTPATGKVLQCVPLDPGWDGANIVMGHDYQHEDRLFGYGEIDMIMPKIRAINRSNKLLGRSLEFECCPIVVADKDNAIKFNRGTVQPGDTLFKKHGSDVSMLRIYGPVEHQFELQQSRKADIQDVSGVTPAQEGQRPAGIEAAAALQALLSQALKRTQGKGPQILWESAQVVKKQMVWLSEHLDQALLFLASDGQDVSLHPEEFYNEFGLRFDERTATQEYRDRQRDELLMLLGAGVVDPQYVIEQLELPGGDELAARMAKQQMLQMLLDAKAKSQGGGSSNSKGRAAA